MKTIHVCNQCHSANIHRDAAININSGEVHEYDRVFCVDCGNECGPWLRVRVPDTLDILDAPVPVQYLRRNKRVYL